MRPFAIELGAPSPAAVTGYFDLEQYQVTLSGNAELARLLNVARAMGIGAPAIGLAGPAQINLKIAGAWTGFAPPQPSGDVKLTNDTAELQGVLEPLLVDSATVTLGSQLANISNFAAGFAGGPSLSGTGSFPLLCNSPETCVLHFELHTPEISIARINRLLNPAFQSQPWYQHLAVGQRNDSALMRLRAVGRITAGRLLLGNLPASNVIASAEVNSGAVSLKDVRADILGGRHTGNWDGDFTAKPPKFFGSGNVTKIAMAQLAILMHDAWATGTLDGQYTLGLTGLDASSLRDSATGSATFQWTAGTLRHIALEGKDTPLSFTTLSGQLAIRNGTISFEDSKMNAGGQVYSLKGNASFAGDLDMQLEGPGTSSYAISGPLDKPRVEAVPVPASEAKLH
jgi:hypothetical protein